jgi:YHS domain-containing protein
MKKKIIMIALLVVISLVVIASGLMVANRILPIGLGMHKPIFNTHQIALDGYDITTYHDHSLQKGIEKFSTKYKDVSWHFVTEESLKSFMADPKKFIPQFGGYCTKAISTGFVAPADAKIYTIFNDKLFIFSSAKVKEQFLSDPASMISACEIK